MYLSVHVHTAIRYKHLKPLGFTPYGHPQLAAKVASQPSILIWGKKDPHSDGIADIEVSYNLADEVLVGLFRSVPRLGYRRRCGCSHTALLPRLTRHSFLVPAPIVFLSVIFFIPRAGITVVSA